MTDKTTGRCEPRALLALIALATQVPTPREISIHADRGSLWLRFDVLAHGMAWGTFLGGETDTYVNTDGRRYLDPGSIEWHGWKVNLHVSEPVKDETEAPLTEAVAERLAALTTPPHPPAVVVIDVDDCAREVAAALSGRK